MSGAITAGTIAAAGIGAAGSIGSSLIGANAAGNAASAQQKAAQQAAQLQQQGSNNALNYQNGIYGQTEQNLSPYINAGGGALNNLSYLLGVNPTNSFSPVQGAQPLQLSQNGQPMTGATQTPGITSPVQGGSPSLSPSVPSANPVSGMQPLTGINPGVSPSGSPLAGNNSDLALHASGIPQVGAVSNPAGGALSGPVSAGSGSPGGFGSLTAGYGQTFQAPTGLTEQNDPGYQARLALGQTAMEKSAAARGNLLTGGTAQAENQAAQDYASNEYGNVYNRALQTFGTNYGVWNNDQNNTYSRLMGLVGSGQNAATNLGSFGQQSANNVTGNLLGTGQQIGQDYGAGAAANASGIYNSGAAWQSGLGGATSNLSNLLYLRQLQGGGGYGGVNANSMIPGVAD